MGITGLLQRKKVSGKELSKITGHFTFRALIRRELLSCLSAVFAFQERHWSERTMLWDSVKTELILAGTSFRWHAEIWGPLGALE